MNNLVKVLVELFWRLLMAPIKNSLIFIIMVSLILASCFKVPNLGMGSSDRVDSSKEDKERDEGSETINQMNSTLNDGGAYELTINDLDTLKAQGAISDSEYEELRSLMAAN